MAPSSSNTGTFRRSRTAHDGWPWITGANIDGRSLRRPARASSWSLDKRIDLRAQAGNEVYSDSGFSRGHMVRRLDPVWGSEAEVSEANADTFHFTNCCPQEQVAFNDKLWGDLEDYILEKADAEDIKINVYTGPIFKDDDPEVKGLASPMSFWKVVAWKEPKGLRAVGFVLSQAPFVDIEFAGGPYRASERSLASIGRAAGITFEASLLDADVHRGEESAPNTLRALSDLDRLFAR